MSGKKFIKKRKTLKFVKRINPDILLISQKINFKTYDYASSK